MTTINDIFAPYEVEGRSAMILTGRSIYDSECRENGSISTLVQQMAEYAKGIHMVMVRYSLASGVIVPYNMYERSDVETIKKVLSSNGVSNATCSSGTCQASQEFVEILRGISRMASSSNSEIMWKDGNQMKFLFLFDFSSDIMPNATNDNQKLARELIYQLANSDSFLDNGNLLILSDVVEGKIDGQVQGLLYHKILPYPNAEEKLSYLKGLHLKYPNAQYASGLDDHLIATLSSCTPNRSLDLVFRTSHFSGRSLDVKGIVEQKMKDVQEISEGTVTMLDTSRVKNVELKGENIRTAMEFLKEQANGLLAGNKAVHCNILLMGAPGTAKTDLAYLTSDTARCPIYQINSPKTGIVGETERKAALLVQTITATFPSIDFIDEITEAMPMQRIQNLDSGASDAVMQAMLNVLSNNTREGRSILIATTNCGYKLGAAMLDRFSTVPVIMPPLEDFPEIICSIAKQVSGSNLNPADVLIQKAAKCFYDKHIMPRRIRAALKLVCSKNGLTPKAVYEAAKDANPLDEASWLSAVYADLYAISLTVSKRLLPWHGRENNYPFPDYIRAILDENHQVDPVKLNNEIKRLQPYANV